MAIDLSCNYPEHLNASELLFLLQLTDSVFSMSTEDAIFEETAGAFAIKMPEAEVVIYDVSKSDSVLKARAGNNGFNNGAESCIAHFELYRDQHQLSINDVKTSSNAALFTGCDIMAVTGISFVAPDESEYILELRNKTVTEWEPSLHFLLQCGLERALKAVAKVREVDEFRKTNFELQTTANAMGLSAWSASLATAPEPEEISEIDNLKYALLKAALPGDVLSDIGDEDIPRVEIEIARAFAEGKDYEIEYKRSGAEKPEWVKLHGGRRTDAAGRAHLWGAEMDISGFKSSQAELIKDKKNQEFLLTLTDALSTIADPVEVQKTAAEMLGKHFSFSMAHYSTYNNGTWTTEWQYVAPGVGSSMVGSHHDDDHPLITSYLKSGETFISGDLVIDTRLEEQERKVMKELKVSAVVMTPIFTSGVLKGSFVVAQDTVRDWEDDEISLIKEVARRTQGSMEHLLSQKLLEKSEESFRSLFDNINVGAAIIKVFYDAEGVATDVLFEKTNLAAAQLIGTDLKGKTAKQGGFMQEQHWFDIYGRVAKTGVAEKHTLYSPTNNKWFELNVVKQHDTEGDDRVAAIFDDITKKVIAAEKETRVARFDNYQLKINDVLRTVNSPEEVVKTSMKMIADALGADRALFGESDAEKTRCLMSGYQNGKKMFPEIILSENFGFINTTAQNNIPVLINDVRAPENENIPAINHIHGISHVCTEEERKNLLQYKIMSLMVFPIVKGNQWVGNVSIHCNRPRVWNQEEFDFLQDASERTWEVMLRLRSEEAVREAGEEHRIQLEHQVRDRTAELKIANDFLQAIFDSSPNSITTYKPVVKEGEVVDFTFAFVNEVTKKTTGRDFTGLSLTQTYPEVEQNLFFDKLRSAFENKQTEDFDIWHEEAQEWYRLIIAPTDEMVVVTTEIITVQKKAREQILQLKDEIAQKATDKYYSIFNSIDEGFCIYEVLYDDNKPVDLKWVEVNNAYEKQTGLKEVVGKTHTELSMNTESYWYEFYDMVLKTGDAAQFEDWHEPTGRWYYAYSSRIGGADSKQVAVIFYDVTSRKQREMHQQFLLKFSDVLRDETDADSIAQKAVELIHHHLKVDRCYVAGYHLEENFAEIAQQAGNDRVNPMPETIKLSDFPEAMKTVQEGSLIIEDVANDTALSATGKKSIASMGMGALVAATLRKNKNQPVWCMVVVSATPRNWNSDEIRLIEEVAERTWSAVEKVKTETALKKSEEKYRTLFNTVDVGFALCEAIVDENENVTDVLYREMNPAAIAIMGGDFSGKTAKGLYPGTKEQWLNVAKKIIQTGEGVRIEYFSDLAGKWLDAYTFSPDGILGYRSLAIVFQDVTWRRLKQGEDEREARQDASRVTLNDALRTLDDPQKILEVSMQSIAESLKTNRALFSELEPDNRFFNVVSYSRGVPDFPGTVQVGEYPDIIDSIKNGAPVVINDLNNMTETNLNYGKYPAVLSYVGEKEREHLLSHNVRSIMVIPIFRNGEWKANVAVHCADANNWTEDHFDFLHEMAERVWMSVQRVKTENELARSRNSLQDLLKQQNEFLRIATHEVRTPLTVIKLAAQWLTTKMVSVNDDTTKNFVDKINQSVSKLTVLFDDLMHTTKLADGSLALRPSIFNLEKLVAEAVADQRSLTPQRQIVNKTPAGLIEIEADKARIEQVILNLLSNAHKYSPGDKEITVKARVVDGVAQVCVKDNGAGIPEEEQEKIFERFYRSAVTSGQDGLGVGLYISNMIVKMHGGKMWVESVPGKGSAFYFTLPVKKNEDN